MTKHSAIKTPVGGAAILGSTAFGAVIGGAVAAAGVIPKVRSGDMDKREAAVSVAREAGTTGAATGAAVAVVGALGLGGLLSFVGIVAVATGTKYLLDSALIPSAAPAESATKAAKVSGQTPGAKTKPAAAKKTTKPAARKTTKVKAAAKAKTPTKTPTKTPSKGGVDANSGDSSKSNQ
jgi:hypothetical protein